MKGESEMIIKPSAALRNEYSLISDLAKKTHEPIFITLNGEGDGVFISIETYEKREDLIKLRSRVLQAEQERLDQAKTLSISEARKELNRRAENM